MHIARVYVIMHIARVYVIMHIARVYVIMHIVRVYVIICIVRVYVIMRTKKHGAVPVPRLAKTSFSLVNNSVSIS